MSSNFALVDWITFPEMYAIYFLDNRKKRFRKEKIKCPKYVMWNSMFEEDTK